MNRATKLALASALPLVALAAGVPAAADRSLPAASSSAVVASAPDVVTLTDDTGTITVDVPRSWNDVDTAPLAGYQPSIEAAPDRDAYFEAFDEPGVTYRAASFTADTDTLTLNFGVTGGCQSERLDVYDDGAFAGSQRIYRGCGPTQRAEFHVIAANPPGHQFTALLIVQLAAPDQAPILDGILATFNVTDHAFAPVGHAAGVLEPPHGKVPDPH